MTITSTNRKGKNAWEIPSLKTYLTSIVIKLQDEIKTDKTELNKFHASKQDHFTNVFFP
jgi:hypothetical protein